MHRTLSAVALAGSVLALSACSASDGGARQMEGSWEVHLDPDRTVRLELEGSFDAYADKTEADAGETDIFVETFGTISVTNVSDGRSTDEFDTGLQVFVPIDGCPDWRHDSDGELGTHCTRDLVSFEIPNLEVGGSDQIDISGKQRVTSVKEEDAQVVVDAMLGESGTVVSADRVYWGEDLENLNPMCTADSGIEWITYFTEDPDVTACATEVGGRKAS